MMPVEQLPAPSWHSALGLGFVSAVFDNIPLTKLALEQGGYDWGMLAYAVGFGGSMIWFGSSAGVAITNLYPEARSVWALAQGRLARARSRTWRASWCCWRRSAGGLTEGAARVIRNVVFDIGGVLLRLRYQPFIEYLGGAGIDMTNLPRWLEQVDLAAHERGEITGEELLGRIAAMARRAARPATSCSEHWLDMFDQAHEMFDLAAGLLDEYRVFLLSNIGDLHWRHLNARYGFDDLDARRDRVVPGRRHQALGRDLSRGGAAVRPRAGRDGVHRRPAAERRGCAGLRLAGDPSSRPASRRAGSCARSACACRAPFAEE